MVRMAWTVCAYASPRPTITPSGPAAVQPETHTVSPTRTARAYPTSGSHRPPEETRWRGRMAGLRWLPVRPGEVRHHALGEQADRARDLVMSQVPRELGDVQEVGDLEGVDQLAQALDRVLGRSRQSRQGRDPVIEGVLPRFRVDRDAVQVAEVLLHPALEGLVGLRPVLREIAEHRQGDPHPGGVVAVLAVHPPVGVDLGLEAFRLLVGGEGQDGPPEGAVAAEGRLADRGAPARNRGLHGLRPDARV